MLIIEKEFLSDIIAHAKIDAPHESCGILAGKADHVEKVYKMTNTADNPETFYFMDPKEQLKVMKEIRNQELEMIGIYHSHPNSPAYPSAKDVELAFYPEAVYVIISFESKDAPIIKAYKIVEGVIHEEKIANI
ncbi:MAG: M67 family metallopeptidase [Candidatus Poribacteria bacterium]